MGMHTHRNKNRDRCQSARDMSIRYGNREIYSHSQGARGKSKMSKLQKNSLHDRGEIHCLRKEPRRQIVLQIRQCIVREVESMSVNQDAHERASGIPAPSKKNKIRNEASKREEIVMLKKVS